MKKTILLAIFLSCITYSCQKATPENQTAAYFESIKGNETRLVDFFQEMPKGGDIHHHASGSPYAESFLKNALSDSMYINPSTHQLYKTQIQALSQKDSAAVLINAFLRASPDQKDKIIDSWSVRNYKKLGRSGHDQFFSTFLKFMPAFIGYESKLLSELCAKAAKDNISYIETSITVPNIEDSITQISQGITWNPENTIEAQLSQWYETFQKNNMKEWAQRYADSMDSYMNNTNSHGVTIKFQGYGVRVYNNPPMAFGHLILAFAGAELTNNIVGVNFVAPEDNPSALSQYETHMKMFQFLKEKHPSVHITLHAGELVSGKGAVSEKDLKFHIEQAIKTGQAIRIGHGVDINSETNSEEILAYMKEHNIAIEINLESNEVILERNKENHPIHSYRETGVPICISTDDEGVLRTNLTNQYVLLTEYLPDMDYSEVKTIVYNAINYSFLDVSEKETLVSDLDERFRAFETKMMGQN